MSRELVETLPLLLREHIVTVLTCECEAHVITDAVRIVNEAADEIERLSKGDGGEALGRFGHHPDARTDYECEIDALIGNAYERLTMGGHPDLEDRIRRAMEFRTISTPVELRWLNQTFRGVREIYARKPDWVQWPEEKLAALSATPPVVDREAVAQAGYWAALSDNGRKLGLAWDATAASKARWLQFADAMIALLPAVPEGMVLVPKEPTEAMLSAWATSDKYADDWRKDCAAGWSAMIAASSPMKGEGR